MTELVVQRADESDLERVLIEVDGLGVALDETGTDIVEDVSFHIRAGEIVGLVGESGCGKTTVASALLGHARRGARIVRGSVLIRGNDLLSMAPQQLQRLRGSAISYVPQDPGTALNPALRIGRQLKELIEVHDPGAVNARERVSKVMSDVRLPTDASFLRRYPHQLSGGQQQRVCIAMAFLLGPDVVVLDEPTTGLDVTTQAYVMAIVRRMCRESAAAALYVTHDLAVVSRLADRTLVMYAGRVVEDGPIRSVFYDPAHPYTARLIAASPDLHVARSLEAIPGSAPAPDGRPQGCAFHPRCPIAQQRCREESPNQTAVSLHHHVRCHFSGDDGKPRPRPLALKTPTVLDSNALLSSRDVTLSYGSIAVLHGVSVEVRRGECVAIVGESGSGKTSLSRVIVGLARASSGSLTFDGHAVPIDGAKRSDDDRRRIQYVFQNPYASLNPRRTVRQILEKAAKRFRSIHDVDVSATVASALEQVSLQHSVLDSLPGRLSGGERQRVAVARALVCNPDVLICDEITSALDVSVQAAVIKMLSELRDDRGLALIFVTHNLALVRSIADEVFVVYRGKMIESGPTADVMDAPTNGYTQKLLQDSVSV